MCIKVYVIGRKIRQQIINNMFDLSGTNGSALMFTSYDLIIIRTVTFEQ